jgi:dUTP pyrophosphatase
MILVGEGGLVPTRAYPGDAGDDLYTSCRTVILPHSNENIPTGIRVKLPEGYYGRIVGRSSTIERYGLEVLEGIIDNGYTGELFIRVINIKDSVVTVAKNARLAQFIVAPITNTTYSVVDELPETERSTNGFGSSGA